MNKKNNEELKIYKAAMEKTEKEWLTMSPKDKASKILAHLKRLKLYKDTNKKEIQNIILIIEELELSVIEDYLNEIHKVIMGNALKTLGY